MWRLPFAINSQWYSNFENASPAGTTNWKCRSQNATSLCSIQAYSRAQRDATCVLVSDVGMELATCSLGGLLGHRSQYLSALHHGGLARRHRADTCLPVAVEPPCSFFIFHSVLTGHESQKGRRQKTRKLCAPAFKHTTRAQLLEPLRQTAKIGTPTVLSTVYAQALRTGGVMHKLVVGHRVCRLYPRACSPPATAHRDQFWDPAVLRRAGTSA